MSSYTMDCYVKAVFTHEMAKINLDKELSEQAKEVVKYMTARVEEIKKAHG